VQRALALLLPKPAHRLGQHLRFPVHAHESSHRMIRSVVFSAEFPASATRVTVPTEFLQSGTEYELEIQAIEESGNQTFRTRTFLVN
jgi:hypothetical protein